MNILITHFYSRDNNGDAAILSVLIKEVNKVFKSPLIKITTMEHGEKHKDFEGYKMVRSINSLIIFSSKFKIIVLFNCVFLIVYSFIWVLLYKFINIDIHSWLPKYLKEYLNDIKNSDLIILNGGGYLRATKNLYDTFNYLLLLHPIIMGLILNKCIVLHSQSIGPLETDFQVTITKYLLSKVNLIIPREDISLKYLQKLKINNNIIIKSTDAGFLFTSNKKMDFKKQFNISINKNYKVVGVTVRRWLSKEAQSDYESEIAKFCDNVILNKKMNIIFIPQVATNVFDDDDRDVAERIVKKMKYKNMVFNINKQLTHFEIKAIYKNLDFLVGNRFHSVIFSLTSGVPAIAIEYEHKTSGIMHDLHLTEWVIKMESVTSELLYEIFIKLIASREVYLKTLKTYLPAYLIEAEKTIYYIKDAYQKSKQSS